MERGISNSDTRHLAETVTKIYYFTGQRDNLTARRFTPTSYLIFTFISCDSPSERVAWNETAIVASCYNPTTRQNFLTMGHVESEENADARYKTIALLPIPSACLSIFGSWTIIQMAFRIARSKGWTTYNRLLVAMSLCDILVSSHLAFAAFLKPQETSHQPWAVGNDVTCSFSGFMFQFTQASSFIYNTSLSFYFVLSTRARVNKSEMARRYEPWMHLMAIVFPLITSITGLILDVYSEPVLGMSCWVNDYPKGRLLQDPKPFIYCRLTSHVSPSFG